MDEKETPEFNEIKGLKAIDTNTLAEFEREMTEKVIPEIIRAVERRQMLAAESRQKELQMPADEKLEPPE